jgi:hypothetical protein
MSLIPIFNKPSPQVHTESELDGQGELAHRLVLTIKTQKVEGFYF